MTDKPLYAGKAYGFTYMAYPETGLVTARRAYKSDPDNVVSARALEGFMFAWHWAAPVPPSAFGAVKVLNREHPDFFQRWRMAPKKGASVGKLVPSGNNPLRYAKLKSDSTPILDIGVKYPSGDMTFRSVRSDEFQLAAPGLLFNQTPEGGWAKYVLQVERVNVAFRRAIQAMRGCSFQRTDGEWITLTGMGGSGWVAHESCKETTLSFYTQIEDWGPFEVPHFIEDVQATPMEDLNEDELWTRAIRNVRPSIEPNLYEMISSEGAVMGECSAEGALEVVGLKLRGVID